VVARRFGLLDTPDRKTLALAGEFARDMLLGAFTKPGMGPSAYDDRVTCVRLGRFQKVLDDVFPLGRGQKVRFHGPGGNSRLVKDRPRLREDGLCQALKMVEP
jgi:hypothetical protein